MTEFIKENRMQSVILAGGLGSRMGELTYQKQKCMMEVDGAPIIEHIVSSLRDTFGKKMEVIIATGHYGNDVRKYFGDDYQEMKITYVHSDNHLESKNRLLLAKDVVKQPFLLLAGDILTPNFILEKIVDRFYQEKKTNNLLGIMSGAKDISPALTHPILTIDDDNYLKNISCDKNQLGLRDMQRSFYSIDFLRRIEFSEEKLLSRATLDIFFQGEANFGVVEFDGLWAHYANQNDLEKYKNLPFLRELSVRRVV